MTQTVLITTSGTGSRLGKRTRYTNKSLMKIGDKYAICHILEAYPPTTHFVITVGHYSSHVKEFLSLAYPHLTIDFVDVNLYEGAGSSLGYSMLQAKHLLQTPFYFHCCDTIVTKPIPELYENCVFVVDGMDTSSYASVVGTNGVVHQMNAKGAAISNGLYIGLSFIQSFELFWQHMERIYEQNTASQSISDIHAIQGMIQDGCRFTYSTVEGWFDTGNETSYAKVREAFPCEYSVLDKYDESLCFLQDKVIKFFADSTINTKRVKRGEALYPSGPKLLGSTAHFFAMEKIEGNVLSDILVSGTVERLLHWSWETLWSKQDINTNYKVQCLEFYKTKTIKRLSQIPFLEDEKQTVNGLFTGRILSVIESFDFTPLLTDTFSYFHGDFILDNILVCSSTNEFKLIDWRQDFDGNLLYGDFYYDLAKLRHNLYFNHMNILKNLYTIEYKGEEAYIDIKCNFHNIQEEKYIEKFCMSKKLDYTKIKILTAIIWLNMAPLYEGKLREFLFYFGKYNLALTLNTPITILKTNNVP